MIDEKVFNTIKGTNKKLVIGYEDNQIIFNGEDIETPKSIDASIEVRDLSENSIISKVVSDGVIISFSDNGNLPGKANIRIKSNKLLDNVIGDKKAYIYKYNEVTNDFTEIDSNVTLTEEGYYEFTINHNSDYVLVTKKIDKKYLSESEKIVSFQRGDRTNIALIVFGILLIIGVSIAIFFLKNNSKSTVVKEEEIDKKTKKPKKKEIKK